MEKIILFFLWLHIASGTLALLSAPFAVLLRKQTPKHRIAGKIYFYSMLFVVISAIIISLYKSIPFLLMVAVFSFYAIWDARRALALKQLHKTQQPKWYDWAVGIFTFCFNIGLVIFGVLNIRNGNGIGWVATVFGIIGIASVFQSLRKFIKRPTDPKHWLYTHVSGMLAGYIATVTAFMAVNINFLPALVVWLAPTVIGSSLITWFMMRLKTGKEGF